jgi:hypothetical protein
MENAKPTVLRADRSAIGIPAISSPPLRTLAGSLLATIAALGLCGVAKEFIFPRTSLWSSHAITAGAFGLMATLATYHILRRQARMSTAYRRAETERIDLASAIEQTSDANRDHG